MRFKLSPETTLKVENENVLLQTPSWKVSFQTPHSNFSKAMELLVKGEEESKLIDLVTTTSLFFYTIVEKLKSKMMLHYSVDDLITLIPLSPHFDLKHFSLRNKSLKLSRFTYGRLHEGEFIYETPLAPVNVKLGMKLASLFVHLSSEKSLEELCILFPEISESKLEEVLQLLFSAQMVETTEEKALQTWEFHDLVMHTRCRVGRHRNDFGGTFPFLGKIEHEPVVKSPISDEKIILYRPDLQKLKERDPSFTTVLENRKSTRKKTQKLNAEQLGEFLFRSARIKSFGKNDYYSFTNRAYPGGGAMYELEIYPLVHSCDGLTKGLYHYDPKDHLLEKVPSKEEELALLHQDATRSNEGADVLFIISARFHRVSWKYRSVAYSLILKNTGALFQTFYLTASALNLGCCALGGGNADLFSNTIGSNYYQESSVGEFILNGSL
jgi:SagB-type dehydrogenase family enzyme